MAALTPYITKQYVQDIWENVKFKALTEVQAKAIPEILVGNDVMIESPTGTGKTLAYVLPILEKIDESLSNTQVVIVAPSRELVMQIHEVVQQWSGGSEMTSTVLIGGANIKRQIEKLKKNPTFVVGTPGRIVELIKAKKLKMHHVKMIVLDEVDQLLTPEHEERVEVIVRATMKERQLVIVSATLPEKTMKRAQHLMNEPVLIQVESKQQQVKHVYIVTDKRDKPEIVRKLVKGQPMTALLFARDIGNLNVLAQRLEYKGVELSVLHSEATKKEREDAMRQFRTKKHSLLLATDVAARGLDIDKISHVIHYDVPKDANQYTHRSGRTGRMGATGTVISIVTKSEEKELRSIARKLGISVQENILYKGQLQVKPQSEEKAKSRRPNHSRHRRRSRN